MRIGIDISVCVHIGVTITSLDPGPDGTLRWPTGDGAKWPDGSFLYPAVPAVEWVSAATSETLGGFIDVSLTGSGGATHVKVKVAPNSDGSGAWEYGPHELADGAFASALNIGEAGLAVYLWAYPCDAAGTPHGGEVANGGFPVTASADPPFDPADVTDLSLFLTDDAANLFSDTGGTTPAALDGGVRRQASAAPGLPHVDYDAIDATRRADGLEIGVGQHGTLSAEVAFGTGDFTLYCAGEINGDPWCPLGHTTTASGVLQVFGGIYVLSNDNAGITGQPVPSTGVPVLFRVRRSGGTLYMQRTGAAEVSASNSDAFTFDAVGSRVSQGQMNASLDNRYSAILGYSRDLTAGGGADDAAVRAWLADRGYSL